MYHKNIILSLAVLQIIAGNEASQEPFFRKDYKYFKCTGSFYKLHTIPRTWGEAVETCADEGAGLFYPEDESEANVVLDYMNRTQGFYYDLFIGISDLDKVSDFKTIDGRSILEVFTKWDANEPNMRGEERCVILQHTGSLNNEFCSKKFSFICKKTLDSVQWNTACSMPYLNGKRNERFFKKNYKYLDDTKTFYKVHTTGSSWVDAKHTCEKEGASLFFPEDQHEAHAVISYVKRNYDDIKLVYLGISDLTAKTVYKTIDERSIFDVYNKWDLHQPNNVDDVQDCVVLQLSDGTFNDVPCKYPHSYICKKTVATLHPKYPDYALQKQLGSCYRFHSTPMKWTEAQAVCNSEQSHLAVINSWFEARYQVALTAGSPKNPPGDFARGVVHIGFHNQQNEGWNTVTGTTLEDSGYNYWGNIDPYASDRQKCGSMLYDGRLKDIRCDQKAVFICEHEIKK